VPPPTSPKRSAFQAWGVVTDAVEVPVRAAHADVDLRLGTEAIEERLRAAIDAQERAIVKTPAEMRALYAIFFQSSDPAAEYRVDVARSLTGQRRDLANWMREARDAGEVSSSVEPSRIAGQVLSSMIGIVHQWIMDPVASAPEMHLDVKELLDARLSRTGA